MPSIQVKDVPADVHAVLHQRAAAAGRSLQEYLRGRLIEGARQPTLDEVVERASGHSGGSMPLSFAVEHLRLDRGSRGLD